MTKTIFISFLAINALVNAALAQLPDAYWGIEQSQPILDATIEIQLDASLDDLSELERLALPHLLDAGHTMHTLYLEQRHAEALEALDALSALHAAGSDPAETKNLLDLFWLSSGPVTSTLTNQRTPFLPVGDEQAGKNVYPADATRDAIEAFINANPDAEKRLLAERSIVKRTDADALSADLEALEQAPLVAELNPELKDYLLSVDSDKDGFYAVPYALRWASELRQVRKSLEQAALLLEDESPDFAAYLRHRSRDFLTGDYEAGDASWVTGRLGGLNLQIGSYEPYDDRLFSTKAFFGASLLAVDKDKSETLAAAIKDLQALEDSLPYDHPQTVRSDIPVGVYNVIADFGQARGANPASILPNDTNHVRKYGRTILIRNNILTNPLIFEPNKKRFDAVVSDKHKSDLSVEGEFNQALWHEIGHYLGVRQTADDRSLTTALADHNDLIEEMKADLISLFIAPSLLENGYYTSEGRKAHLAAGIRRTLQVAKPRPSQPYGNMQLMQFNFFMESGLIEPDAENGLFNIHYDRYHDVVSELLEKVLDIQYVGDYAMAEEFIKRWNYWDDRLHGVLAEKMRLSSQSRYTLVRYAILDQDD